MYLLFDEEQKKRVIEDISHLLLVLSIRDRQYLTRDALQLPHMSCLRHMLLSRNDMATELASVVRLKMGDVLPHSWGVVDGLNLRMEEPYEPDVQNAYFNSWLQGCFCSSVFLFRADGPIAWYRVNCPGSWHDARIASPLYEKLQRRCPRPFNILSDTAFPRTKLMANWIWAGRKDGDVEPADRRDARREQQRHAAITYMRQSGEWGMGALQGQFGRLKGILPRDSVKRRKILEVIAHLYNFRCRRVGLNQLRTVYDRVAAGDHILWPDTGLAREGGMDRGAAYYRLVP